MLIIGLGHKKGVGKNYTGLMLAKSLYPAKILLTSFAYKLKQICFQLYSWDGMQHPDYYETHPEAKNDLLPTIGKTVRQIWIEVGTPAIRGIVYDKTWVKCTLNRPNTSGVLIITDLRFPNEVEEIRAKDGIVVKIERDSIPITNDVADCALDDYKQWDYIIKNNGTQKDLSFALTPLENEIRKRLNG